MSIPAPTPMNVEQLAWELDEIRSAVIEHARHAFPTLALEDLEDCYGKGTEAALAGSFACREELAAFMHVAVRHAAIDVKRSARWSRTGPLHDDLAGRLAGGEDPAEVVHGRHHRDLLREFLAELDDQDRWIAFLHLDPDHEWTLRQIARALDLPRPEVDRSLKRLRISLSRFGALSLRPGAMCHRRREDVLEWQATGRMPLALQIHMRHCHTCAGQYRDARTALRSAILPLLPAGALPAAGIGMLSRAYRAAGAHPATGRANDALARVRKLAPVGGGGGAAVAAKFAVTTAAVVGVAALHAVTSTPKPAVRPQHHHAALARVANTTAPVLAPMRSVTTVAHTMATVRAARTALVTSATTSTTASAKVAVAPPPNATSASPASTKATIASAGATASSAAARTGVAPPPVQPASSATGAHSTTNSSGTSTIAGPPAPGGAPPP